MIGLVDTLSSTFSLTDIKGIEHVSGDIGRASHYLVRRHSETTPVRLFEHEYTDLKLRPVQIMPADSGTKLICVYSLPGDKIASADADAVLAWSLCYDGRVRPILPSGVRRDYQFDADLVCHSDYVQMPDGSIYQYGYEAEPGAYANIDEVIATETKRIQRHEAERQRKAAAKLQDGEGIAA